MNGLDETGFHAATLDAIPSPLFVVDSDVRIVAFNRAATSFLGDTPALALSTKGGEALHCIHAAETAGGCGASEACKTCVVRNAVTLSCRDGVVVRRPQRMQLLDRRGVRVLYLLVTTNLLPGPGRPLAILVLQDISELVSNQGLVPVCVHCRRVRDAANDWAPMERYLKDHLDLDVTHGLCPECLERHYPGHVS